MAIGPSVLESGASKLTLAIEERSPLFGARVAGSIVVNLDMLTDFQGVLDENARHFWQPLSPRVHVEVNFQKPSLSWSGSGYLDMNWGSEPIEEGFAHWNWSRSNSKSETAILYDLTRRTGTPLSLCLRIGADGHVEAWELPQACRLPRTSLWLMPRSTSCDEGSRARVLRTLEDTPFYSRSVISTRVFGETAIAMHESLSLNRFKTRIVQMMLPYRMARGR
jgi:carotenoid 1,2-hydratase